MNTREKKDSGRWEVGPSRRKPDMNTREEKDSGRWEVGPSSAMIEIW